MVKKFPAKTDELSGTTITAKSRHFPHSRRNCNIL